MTSKEFITVAVALVGWGLLGLSLVNLAPSKAELKAATMSLDKVNARAALIHPLGAEKNTEQSDRDQGPTLAPSLDGKLEMLEMQESLQSADIANIWIESHGCRGPCSIYQVVLNSKEVEFTGRKYVAERGVMRRRISTDLWKEASLRARSLQLFKMTQEQIDGSCGKGPRDGRTYTFGLRLDKETRKVKLGRGCRGGFRTQVLDLWLFIAEESGANERFSCDRKLNCLPIGHRWGPDR